MLTVDAKFIASELTPGLVNGKYSIQEGATIRDLIALCEKECGVTVPEKFFAAMYPLYNGAPVMLDSKITENGTLHMCRVVSGG